MATLHVILRGRAVNILYTHGKQQPIPLAISIDPKHFRNKEGKWIKGSKGDDDYNATITGRMGELRTHITRYHQEHKEYPQPKSLKAFFSVKKKAGQSFEQTWYEYIRYQTNKGNESVSAGRVKHYFSAMRFLVEFRPGLNINDIDVAFYDSFKNWLKKTKGNGENRINFYISVLRGFLNWAVEAEKTDISVRVVKKFKTKWAERDIIFNTPAELQKLLDLALPEFSYLDKMRDAYLLQCFIGLRHGDLKPGEWQITNNYLRKLTGKTKEELSLPLRSEARFLLEKYTLHNIPFPEYENQPYNRAIKEISRLAGIDQEIVMVKGRKKFKPGQRVKKYLLMSSHTARATFICNMIEANVQSWKIMKMTGIKKETTLKHYAAVMEMSLQPDIEQLEQKQGLRVTHIRRAV